MMKLAAIIGFCILILTNDVAAASTASDPFAHGRQLFNRGEYSKAVTVFEMIDSALNTQSEFHYYYGLSLLKTDQAEKAISAVKQAIELEPDNADYRYVLGLVYAARTSELSLLRAAMMIGPSKETLLEVLELNANHVGATKILAELLLDVPSALGGDEKEAANLIKKLWNLEPASATTLEAKIENRKGNYQRAEKLFLQAVETPGSETLTRLKLSKFYLDRKEYLKAIQYGEQYLNLPKHWSEFPNDTVYAHAWLAMAYHALGDQAKFDYHSQVVNSSKIPKRTKKEIANYYRKAGIKI